MKKCLACYEPIKSGAIQEFHEKCSKRVFGSSKAPNLLYNFSEINELAKEVINHRLAIPGVQPKLSLVIEKSSVQNNPSDRLTIVGLWDGTFVLKPTNNAYKELPENEDVTMHMAETCGIETATHSLIRFESGEIAYIAKRFDRVTNRKKVEKLHQEDMCQLTGLLTENKYNSSMENIAKIVAKYSTNKGLELLSLFQVTIFSFLTGNADMHLKNFSLLKYPDGTIGMTPAYDLLATALAVPEDNEQLALTLNGKKNKLSREDFDKFAEYCQIPAKAAQNVLADFESKLPKMKLWIEKSFLSRELKKQYLHVIANRAQILDLEVPVNFLRLEDINL